MPVKQWKPTWVFQGKICRCPGCRRWLIYTQIGPAKMRFATDEEVKEMTKGKYGMDDSTASMDILYGARACEDAPENPDKTKYANYDEKEREPV